MYNTTFSIVNKSIHKQEDVFCHFSESVLTRTLKTVALLSTGLLGICGNIFIVVLAAKYTARKNLHHLIVNMAVSDTLVVLTTLFNNVPKIVDNYSWMKILIFGGDTLCQVICFLLIFSISISFLTLLIISIERFRATRFQTARSYTLRKRSIELILSWAGSFVMSFIRNFKVYVLKDSSTGAWICQIDHLPMGWEYFFFFTVALVLFVIFTLSGVTLRRLSLQQTINNNLPEVQRQARVGRLKGAIKMVITSLVLYSCCYVPFVVWKALKRFHFESDYTNQTFCTIAYVFENIEAFLPLINSCLSPVIYLIFLSDFRRAATELTHGRIFPLESHQQQ